MLLSSTEGIVERAVLIGAPVSVKDELWKTAGKVWVGWFWAFLENCKKLFPWLDLKRVITLAPEHFLCKKSANFNHMYLKNKTHTHSTGTQSLGQCQLFAWLHHSPWPSFLADGCWESCELWMCTPITTGLSVSLSVRGKRSRITQFVLTFKTATHDWNMSTHTVHDLINALFLMQPAHARFGWHPGRPCPRSWKRKCAWHIQLSNVNLFIYAALCLIMLLDSQVDATELVVEHSSYLTLLQRILGQLELNNTY